MKSFKILKLLFMILLFIYSINCETIINYSKSVVFITILPNSTDNIINSIDLLCLVNLECTYNGAIQGFGSNRIAKNMDGSNSCNSTFDFTGYTDFQRQDCKGTLLYKITNKIVDEKISIPISFPVEIDDSHLYTNGTSSLKIRYYDGSKANTTPMTITDITGKVKEIRNLKYENSLIYNQPGLLSWTMDAGFGYVLINFGGEQNQNTQAYKATYPKPIINSARVISMDIEKGSTQIEFLGINFGTNKKLLTFMPNCYPFPYKISIDYVNSTNLVITDFNKLKGLCPTRDFKYTLCLDNYCGQGQLKEGYPPVTINSIDGPTANRTYKFNGYFLDSTTYSQLTPVSQYGQKLSSSINQIELQINSPTYYQYASSGGRAFKFWDKNSNGTSISIPIQPSTLFDCGAPTLLSTSEQQGKLKVVGKYFMFDMMVFLDGMKLNQSVFTIVNSTTFYITPIPRPGILTVSIDGSNDNSSIPIRINVLIKEISSPSTKGGLITIKGNGLYLKSENGKPLKSKFTIENFSNNNEQSCQDPIEDPLNAGEIIYCKVSPGIGKKLMFKLEIGDSKPAIFTNFTYQPPSITKVIQSSDFAIVDGSNLGEQNSKVYIYINNEINGKVIVTPLPVLTNSSELIQFPIPDSIKTSIIYIEVGGQKSNSLQLPIVPFITSIPSKLSVNGGIVTIVGKYLNLLNYNFGNIIQQQEEVKESSTIINNNNNNNNNNDNNNNNNLKIKIGSKYCNDIQQFDLKHFTSITCKMPSGSGGNFPISILINDTLVQGNPKGLTFSYMSPTIINSTSVSPTTGGLITIFGSQLAKPINITIANLQQCIYVNITDSSSLTCYLPPLSESLNKSSIERSDHQIQINVNGQSSDADIFKYSVPDKYQYRKDNSGPDQNDNSQNVEKWLIPAILIPCLFFLIAIFVLVIIYIKKYKKRRQIQKRLNEPIPSESIQD
ncbi:hypothetical protein RB653_010439 [Dictyostelium firmibasis]|uniref:IPT/TIG domain-containing protein n=1 Tax=Dictyostelium firmibasis TaxID=79012 RepID=A0AAN7TTZ5_9MYCE